MKDLLDHQISALEKLKKYKVGALFMKMGSGKTRVAVELVNSVEDIDLVVYIAPLGIVRPKDKRIASVKDEVDKWGGFEASVVYVGIESIQASDRIYLELRGKIQSSKKPFIVVDESIKIKNIESKRTNRLLDLSSLVEYKIILNGEPITKNLLDIYPQINFLSPKILNMTHNQFKNTYCCYKTVTKKFGSYQYSKEFITGYANIDHLYSLIGEYVYECDVNFNIDRMFKTYMYEVDDYSLSVYNDIKEKFLSDEMLLWRNNNIFLEMTQKMQHAYSCTEDKFNAVEEWFSSGIDESKTIIFCKYISSRKACRNRFPDATVLSYQQDSYGHNLPHLPNMVMFDKTWDLNLRNQALARNFRIDSSSNVRVLDLTGDIGLDKMIDKNIHKKVGMLEYFKKKAVSQLRKEL